MIYKFNKKTLLYENITALVMFWALIILTSIVLITSILIKEQPLNKQSCLINSHSQIVTATCYRAVEGQCDDTPLITADGSEINISVVENLRWMAVSRDLEKTYKMGDSIIVEGIGKGYDGLWIVKDRMNKRFKNKIDFLISDKQNAGLFTNVKITKI